jgi:hypothetical protein
MMKSFYGDNATAENQWGYHWLPKWDKSYDCMVSVLSGSITTIYFRRDRARQALFLSGKAASRLKPDNATAENQWGYHWLPKWDKSYDCMAQAEMMEQGPH